MWRSALSQVVVRLQTADGASMTSAFNHSGLVDLPASFLLLNSTRRHGHVGKYAAKRLVQPRVCVKVDLLVVHQEKTSQCCCGKVFFLCRQLAFASKRVNFADLH